MTAIQYHLAAPILFLALISAALVSCFELVINRDFLGPLWRRWGNIVVWLALIMILIGWGINLAAYFGH